MGSPGGGPVASPGAPGSALVLLQDREAAWGEEDEHQQGECGGGRGAGEHVVDGRVDGPAQVVRRGGGELRGVLQGVRDRVQVAGESGDGGVGQPGGEYAVGDGAEERGAQALADLAAEEDGRGGRPPLGPADGRLDPDDQRQLEEAQRRTEQQHQQGGCQAAPG